MSFLGTDGRCLLTQEVMTKRKVLREKEVISDSAGPSNFKKPAFR